METILITINDVRQYRQISKQVNADNFTAYARSIQRRQLSDLLGKPLYTDLQKWIATGWANEAATSFRKDSAYTFTALGADLSTLATKDIKISTEVFNVLSAVYDSTDTLVTVSEARELPNTIATVESKAASVYTSLLNGAEYTNTDGDDVQYYGLRAFLAWHWLSMYTTDGTLKQADAGNVNFTDSVYNLADGAQLKRAKDVYLSESVSAGNDIIEYMDANESAFGLWDSKSESSVKAFDFFVI